MRLSLLMYGFYWLFKFAPFLNRDFKNQLNKKDVTLIMKSKDETRARTFIFEKGRVRSKRGQSPRADGLLIWATVKDGADIMTQIAMGRPKVIASAVSNKQLLLEGDAGGITWFVETLNKMGKIYYRFFKRNK